MNTEIEIDAPSEEAKPPITDEAGDALPESKQPENPVRGEAVSTLDIVVTDAKTQPIPGIALRIIDLGQTNPRKKVLFEGKADAQGKVPSIENLPVDTRFEVQIKRDNGEYKFSAIGTIEVVAQHAINLNIPRQRFEFTTLSHVGVPGQAEAKVKALVSKHNQTPEPTPNISRNPPTQKPAPQIERNQDGHPVAVLKGALANMWGTNSAKVASPAVGMGDLEKVKALIDFATEQATWLHPGAKGATGTNKTSATIIAEMKQGTFVKAGTKAADKSAHLCNKYVKIALWKAGYSHNNGDIGPLISPAKDMGPALEAAGFINITKNIPDGRWAAPGDVIVYTDKRGADRAGHIDIRTYDGYVSDFIGTRLPTTGYKVTGIYRKYYDPLPELRMRAFLDVIASQETHGIEQAKSWYVLNSNINGSKYASDLNSHPWNGLPRPISTKENPVSTAAGRYQLTITAWKEANENGNDLLDFTKSTQDRLAVIRLEYRKALGLVRKGDIEAAVSKLTSEWIVLPGAKNNGRYKMSDLLLDYTNFLNRHMK